MEWPKPNEVILITFIGSGEKQYGVHKLPDKFYTFKEIRSSSCNCVTGHTLFHLSTDIWMKEWEYPPEKARKNLNYIYSEHLE